VECPHSFNKPESLKEQKNDENIDKVENVEIKEKLEKVDKKQPVSGIAFRLRSNSHRLKRINNQEFAVPVKMDVYPKPINEQIQKKLIEPRLNLNDAVQDLCREVSSKQFDFII
jgi:hypothetical protein